MESSWRGVDPEGGKHHPYRPIPHYLFVVCWSKNYFGIISKRLYAYLGQNTYIDTAVQKGNISGMLSYMEHTGMVTQLIREARENKCNLYVLLRDFENAFSPIPRKLVQFTLTKHQVPSKCRYLIFDYCINFKMRVSWGTITSRCHKVEIGIIKGYTIYVTLYFIAMNMLTESAEPEFRGPLSKSGQRQPPSRVFLDGLTLIKRSALDCQ